MLTNYNKSHFLPKISMNNTTGDESIQDYTSNVQNTIGNNVNENNNSLLKHGRLASEDRFTLKKNISKCKEDNEQEQPKIMKVFRKNNK